MLSCAAGRRQALLRIDHSLTRQAGRPGRGLGTSGSTTRSASRTASCGRRSSPPTCRRFAGRWAIPLHKAGRAELRPGGLRDGAHRRTAPISAHGCGGRVGRALRLECMGCAALSCAEWQRGNRHGRRQPVKAPPLHRRVAARDAGSVCFALLLRRGWGGRGMPANGCWRQQVSSAGGDAYGTALGRRGCARAPRHQAWPFGAGRRLEARRVGSTQCSSSCLRRPAGASPPARGTGAKGCA